MIFSKHINRYYLRHLFVILVGLAALVLVDYLQMKIPELYQMVINGINTGYVDGVRFDIDFLVTRIAMPMVGFIICCRRPISLRCDMPASKIPSVLSSPSIHTERGTPICEL